MSAPSTAANAVLVGVQEDQRGTLITLRMVSADAARLLDGGAWGEVVTVTHPAPVETSAPIDRGPRP